MSDHVVRYKCTAKACRHEGELEVYRLADDGCTICGCKRLEIYNFPGRGHLIMDYGSQKSRRKQKKHKRLRQNRKEASMRQERPARP